MSSAIDALPPLRAVINENGLRARQSLGQNFLLDLNLTGRIARAAEDATGDLSNTTLIEIGPGPGGLTRALLSETGAKQVIAIERDTRCIEALQPLVAAADGRLKLVEGDALEADYETLCDGPRAIAANLPYNISTVLLTNWLKTSHLFDAMTLMFQTEVAERLHSTHGNKTYGRLSVITQWVCAVTHLFNIPPGAFTPPPKVSSSVVRMVPRRRADDDPQFETVEKLTAAAFGQRRKMLRKSLKTLGVDTDALLTKSNITPTARAEDIPVQGFIDMAKVLEKLSRG